MSKTNWLFDSIRVKKPKLNAFDLSFENRFSCEFGQLIPIVSKEVLPGDKWKMDFNQFVRLAPMVSPLMGRIDVDIRAFFVPNRLLTPDWEEFITGGIDGNSTARIPLGNYGHSTHNHLGVGTLADYLNFHTQVAIGSGTMHFNWLPFYAYYQVWNDWYRDELLESPVVFSTQSADNAAIKYRSFHKDYFTSARPSAQLGSPVSFDATVTPSGSISADGFLRFDGTFSGSGYHDLQIHEGSQQVSAVDGSNHVPLTYSDGLKFVGDSVPVSLGTIANLRRAFKIQEWQEKSSRGGNRYIENILVHFGVKSSDARLQRSQYLGGFSSPVVVSDVAQNSASSSSTTPIGTLAGKGVSVGSNHKPFSFTSEEHGFIIVMFSALPHVGYTQGIDRKFLRLSKFDFAWPEFANIGEQGISNSELYCNGDTGTFGYQSRYAEYKSSFDEVHGEFLTSLNSWIQSRDFASTPSLNGTFVSTQNSISNLNRIFATQNVPGTHHLYCQVFCDLKALRPLPKYSIPSML